MMKIDFSNKQEFKKLEDKAIDVIVNILKGLNSKVF